MEKGQKKSVYSLEAEGILKLFAIFSFDFVYLNSKDR